MWGDKSYSLVCWGLSIVRTDYEYLLKLYNNLNCTTMKKVLFGLVLAAVALPLSAQQKPVYLDASKPIEERVEDALSRLTLEEKVKLTHAQSKFSSAGVPRLGIPDVWTDDGPHGIRPDVLWDEWEQAGCTNDSCVAFPALTCLAATWNPEMSLLYGQSIGEEARYRNKSVLLGSISTVHRSTDATLSIWVRTLIWPERW